MILFSFICYVVDKFEGITVEKISYDFEDEGKLPQFSGEGRTITVEFDKFIFICCYVPNSGEGNVFLLTEYFIVKSLLLFIWKVYVAWTIA